MSEKWIVVPSAYENRLELEDPEGWYSASVRRDGCIDLSLYSNRPMHDPERTDYDDENVHICDIDDLIARLQQLRPLAMEHFKDTDSPWEPV